MNTFESEHNTHNEITDSRIPSIFVKLSPTHLISMEILKGSLCIDSVQAPQNANIRNQAGLPQCYSNEHSRMSFSYEFHKKALWVFYIKNRITVKHFEIIYFLLRALEYDIIYYKI